VKAAEWLLAVLGHEGVIRVRDIDAPL